MNKGSALTVFIFVVIVIIISGSIGGYFLFKQDIIEDPLEISISQIISQDLGVDVKDLKVSIANRDGIYTSGVATIDGDNVGYFYAVFTGGIWRLVDVGNDISCERLNSLGFEDETLDGCISKHASAKTVSQALEEEVGNDVEVIAIVSSIDPSNGDISISSGGSDTTINPDSSNAEEGDVVIVEGTISEDGTIDADSATDVGEEDDDIVESISNDNDDEDEESDEVSESEIEEPDTVIIDDDSNDSSVFDRNLGEQIRIRND